jgi:hypothetical protein
MLNSRLAEDRYHMISLIFENFQKDDEYIEFNKGNQFANIALEFQIMKEEDENKRGGHAQALKFYNNE